MSKKCHVNQLLKSRLLWVMKHIRDTGAVSRNKLRRNFYIFVLIDFLLLLEQIDARLIFWIPLHHSSSRLIAKLLLDSRHFDAALESGRLHSFKFHRLRAL